MQRDALGLAWQCTPPSHWENQLTIHGSEFASLVLGGVVLCSGKALGTMVQLAASAQEREAKGWENSRQECFGPTMCWTQAQNSRGHSRGFVSCVLRLE